MNGAGHDEIDFGSTNKVSERLITIEVLLKQVLSELKKGDLKFEKIEEKMERQNQHIAKLEKQQSYWQGALAVLAVVWTVILKWLDQ